MNILKMTIGYLAETLEVPVSTDVPANRPLAFVTVNRDGGEMTAYSDNPTLTVQVWHKDRLQLESLADDVVDALIVSRDAIDGISHVDVQKSYFPEQGTQTFPRYVLTCTIYCGR